MKKYLVLHAGKTHTEFMFCPDRTTIRNKCSLQQWEKSNTVTCELIGEVYRPILFPSFDRLIVNEAYCTMRLYLINYNSMLEHLAPNFPLSISLDRSIRV